MEMPRQVKTPDEPESACEKNHNGCDWSDLILAQHEWSSVGGGLIELLGSAAFVGLQVGEHGGVAAQGS